MRHYLSRRAILLIPVFLATCAWADQPSDSAAIAGAIAALNDPTQRETVIADHGTAASELEALRKIQAHAFRIPAVLPTVTISHEPWGEATLGIPGPAEPILFLTPDVALAEGSCTADGGRNVRLLFAMKKEGGVWKIASVRVLAP